MQLARCNASTGASRFKLNDSSTSRVLKRLETARMARLKQSTKNVVHTIKRADQVAREQFVEDLDDITKAIRELLEKDPHANESPDP